MSVMNTIKKFNNNNNNSPTSNNNAKLTQQNNNEDVAQAFKAMVSKRENLQHLGGMSEASSEGTTHSVRQEEQAAFSNWINIKLLNDPDLKHLLPLNENGDNLYESIKDGILLCKIINFSCPDTIDERAINKKNLTLYTKHENLTLALNSAQAIGCNIVNIDAHDLAKGKPHLVLGLLWQIIRIGIFNQINLEHCPGLVNLVGGDIDDLMKMSPETILLRWVNHHLTNAGSNRRMNNFTKDITDSEIYTHLLYQIAPKQADVTTEALYIRDLLQRAETMLQQADKLGCRSFLSPQDVVSGIYKLNVAFLANLFNKYPALDIPEEPIQIETIEETRAEKTWRNWMNSLGVSPFVNRLYNDIADGLVLIQLCDIIKPGIVQWSRVHKQFSRLKGFMERLENCNYTVELGKMLQFSLVGVAGQDIVECNKTLVSALIWQLMRAYTLSILTHLATADGNGKSKPVDEAKIVEWVNGKLKAANKTTSIRGFNDSSIATALPVIDLVDAIKPESVNYGQVLPGKGPEEKLANSKYAISMARKIGAKVYALPEDIAELKPKMVMTVFACLMARDYVPSASEPPAAISSSSGVDSSLSSSNNDSLSSNNTDTTNNKVPNNSISSSNDGLMVATAEESTNGNHH